ncbi:MAG: hypothetical protein AAF298_29700 [Cyanobacteria bacterium P01_A01_bin.40]
MSGVRVEPFHGMTIQEAGVGRQEAQRRIVSRLCGLAVQLIHAANMP